MQTTKAQISLRICTVHQLALESMIAEPATCKKKIKFNRQTCMRGSRQFQRGGGGSELLLEKVHTETNDNLLFSRGGPDPLPLSPVSAHISFKQFELNRQEKMHMKMSSPEVVCCK